MEVERIKDLVESAARPIARQWYPVMDPEDLAQELWLWLLKRPTALKYVQEKSPGEAVNALKRQATAICSKERTDYEYFSGNFRYTPRDVKNLLECVNQGIGIQPEETADLEYGYQHLSKNHLRNIQRFFLDGEKADSNKLRKRKSRSLEQLTDTMNRLYHGSNYLITEETENV